MNIAADLLDIASFDAGLASVAIDFDFAPTGCNAAIALNLGSVGGNTAAATAFLMGGAAIQDVLQTGTAGAAGALLVGAAGIDTLGDVAFGALGGTTLLDHAMPTTTGVNLLLGAEGDVEAATTSRDLSVSVILYRIEAFSRLAPTVVGLYTGSAF